MAQHGKRIALAASRGAALAVHSATGLALAATAPEVVRLLRAAEGLVRTAVVVLGAVDVVVVPSPAGAQGAAAVPSTAKTSSAAPAGKRRRRRRPKKTGEQSENNRESEGATPAGSAAAPADECAAPPCPARLASPSSHSMAVDGGGLAPAAAAATLALSDAVGSADAVDVDQYMEGSEGLLVGPAAGQQLQAGSSSASDPDHMACQFCGVPWHRCGGRCLGPIVPRGRGCGRRKK